MRVGGKIEIRAVALEPIHHGGGSSGNTQLLRTQSIVLPDGTPARVPFVSGNSLKHRLRINAVGYALRVLEVEDGAFSKGEVDLLFSGGRLAKGGSAINLAAARQMESLFPALSLCGYSAGNAMVASKIRVSHLHVVCAENAWRLPEDLSESPMRAIRCGSLRSEEFGTRHDVLHDPQISRYVEESEVVARAAKKSEDAAKKAPGEKGDSLQMIYDFQVLSAGANLWGEIAYEGLTDHECAALASAFHNASNGVREDDSLVTSVGGKSANGFGSIAMSLRGYLRVSPPQWQESTSLVAGAEDASARYDAHLRDKRAEILAAIREAGA